MQQRAKRLAVLVFDGQWVHSVVFQTLSLGSFAKWVSRTKSQRMRDAPPGEEENGLSLIGLVWL